MTNDDSRTRTTILRTTYELLSEEPVEKLSIRKIASRANVAVSSINYHFQTKENLINMAVEYGVGDIVKSMAEMYNVMPGEPIEKLFVLVKNTCFYIAHQENISKISMLNDLRRSYGYDNITQSTDTLKIILKDIFDGKNFPAKTNMEINIMSYQISSIVHFGFFRSEQLKAETGLDFFNDEDRDIYVDIFLNNLIPK